MTDIDTLVMFGATGDLARKKLFPALYRLEERKDLDQQIVGVALEDWDRNRFRDHVSAAITAAIDRPEPGIENRLLDRLDYVPGDYRDAGTFRRLAEACDPGARLLHYFAIPPAMFERVLAGLGAVRMIESARILVEKPFGRDLESARHLSAVLHRVAPEEAIYRIDHFLGRESVENLLAFRYANPIFHDVWDRNHIDHVQITMAESFAVEDRGALYDSIGVVRDVIQNHILQVICMLAMEAPVTPAARSFAQERTKILTATRTVDPDRVLFGQYAGYRQVPHVAADSRVATYVALDLAVETPRWYGVPFYIRAGKALATTATQAVVVFKEAPPLPFSRNPSTPETNRLVFRLNPRDGVDLKVQTKLPGDGVRLSTTPLTVDYDRVFGRIPLAYERVLHDALVGDQSQFAHETTVEEAWRIVSAILDPATQPAQYQSGSWGPTVAEGFLNGGRRWIDPE
jgi:glucose-6-phosphate 1-dehydrogenase